MSATVEPSGTGLVLVVSVNVSRPTGFAAAWMRTAPIVIGVGKVNVIQPVTVPVLHSSVTSPLMAFVAGSVASAALAVPPVSAVGVVAEPLGQPARSRARTKAGVPRCEDRDDRTAPNNPGSNQVMEYRGITPAGTFKGASVPATKIVGGACNTDGSHG